MNSHCAVVVVVVLLAAAFCLVWIIKNIFFKTLLLLFFPIHSVSQQQCNIKWRVRKGVAVDNIFMRITRDDILSSCPISPRRAKTAKKSSLSKTIKLFLLFMSERESSMECLPSDKPEQRNLDSKRKKATRLIKNEL